MNKKERYYLSRNGEFIIENYHLAKLFSSFFPGIAGIWGIPIWVFYVNRGQAIASFGIRDKDHPIMEFQPANKAYYLTPLVGFRTFIKIRKNKEVIFYDVFNNGVSSTRFDIENKMIITSYDLKLQEINRTLGMQVDIEYFTIPNDNYGALARKVIIKNISRQNKTIDILDGIPQIIPYGLDNMFLKKLSRTVEAWMGVENLDNKTPYLRLKQDPTDRPEVIHIKEGNFYLIFNNKGLIRPIVDPEAVFGETLDFAYPKVFLDNKKFAYPKVQQTKSKTPCCMGYLNLNLKPDASYSFYSLAGNMDSLEKLNQNAKRIADEDYMLKKQNENKKIICDLVSAVFTNSSSKSFNAYCAQNFLDNVMRGGFPLSIKHAAGETHIQVFTRKHGDLERDYNKYLIEPTYFSQGNGNFRDINQNRRCDIWFEPSLREESILTFFNLIQTDGYNPLVIKPARFVFNGDIPVLNTLIRNIDTIKLKPFIEKPFTPGELFLFIEHNDIRLLKDRGQFLNKILANSTKCDEAEHGEGFWTDHWHYCLDLLESYLALYPENLKEILIEGKEFTFFDNAEFVRPRSEKFVLRNNKVYQHHSVVHVRDKFLLIRQRKDFQHISRAKNGLGDIYKTNLFAKMLVVIANKFASLDPFGVGIEMEADKPNWYDSLNGLPALLGSSTCETFELKRWMVFLKNSTRNLRLDDRYNILIPVELYDLLAGLNGAVQRELDDFGFWDKTHSLKEEYRQKTILGFSGEERNLSIRDALDILDNFIRKIDSGIKKAYSQKHGLYYSYFVNEVSDFEIIDQQHSLVKPLKFKQILLPLFLEAIVHCLRICDCSKNAKELYQAVKESQLFDKRLKMYKVCAPLKDMPEEVGRCRVFTPGWLENESVWLHMEYKYMLELLKAGLYEEFYSGFKNLLIPFQDPARYGRSILENSSFLVSSAFPNKSLHGNGFVARLSGSTAEFINIWLIICAGRKPFYLDNNNSLCLEFKPILPSWLFTKGEQNGFPKDTFAFKFLNKTLVVYHNPKRKGTFGSSKTTIREIVIKPTDKPTIKLTTPYIPAPHSYDIRDGKIERINILLA